MAFSSLMILLRAATMPGRPAQAPALIDGVAR